MTVEPSPLGGRIARRGASRPLYQQLAEALAEQLVAGNSGLPAARTLAAREGLNRATVNAAYRELARRGLTVIRRGRPRKGGTTQGVLGPAAEAEPPSGTFDLARYAPNRELLPPGKVFRWLGLGQGEGETVAQYGSVWGYKSLRAWLASRLAARGLDSEVDRLLLTSGVQHALDLLLRAVAHPGDAVLVEDPTYPGLPPLLSVHGVRAVGLTVREDGIDPDEVAAVLRRVRPRLAILTPTLHNPSGVVWDETTRREVLDRLRAVSCLVVEELFDPALVFAGPVPPPLAALDRHVVAVGSFSKALFPGLRVGWLSGPREVVESVAVVKRATDLSGSPFLEATAYHLCERGILSEQLDRLRTLAQRRWTTVSETLRVAQHSVRWSTPRGGFSTMLTLPPQRSSREVAARAAAEGVWVVPGPAMSVSGRDDVLRLAYAAVGVNQLKDAVQRLLRALEPTGIASPLV